LRTFLKVATIGAVAIGLVAAYVVPGSAVPPANGQRESLVAVGSDTTYFVMDGLAFFYNKNQTVNQLYPVNDILYNAPPKLGGAFGAPTFHVNADANCPAFDYTGSNPPPDGSSAGISALIADGSNGCVDLARSSRGRKSTDPANLKFFAYGLDGLSWTYFPGTHAPTNLTQQQLIDIYTCNASTGLPIVSNWSQVGGTAGTIIKFAPQSLSGTYSFFNSKILNGATIDQNCNSSHLSHFVQEHDNTTITAGQKAFAINAYSFGQWKAAGNGVIPDRRNGGLLGAINGVTPSATTINTSASRFLGTRYVYNVLSPAEPSYNATLRFAGVDGTGAGWLCKSSTAIRSMIGIYGAVPLTFGVTGPSLPSSYCRLEPTPL
jgi:phosphate transport system substrate-binding protein